MAGPSLFLVLISLIATLYSGGFMWHQVLVSRHLASALRRSRAEALECPAVALEDGKPAEVQRLEQRLAEAAAEVSRLRASQSAGGAAALRGRPGQGPRPLAVVAVSSHPGRWALRNAARASWFPAASPAAEGELLVRFVVGSSPPDVAVGAFSASNASELTALRAAAVEAEEAQWGDVLRLEHVERPGDLSEKTLRLLAAALTYNPRFVVKVDDDTWVDLTALRLALTARLQQERLYLGCMRTGSPLSFAGDALTSHLAVGQSLVFSDPEPSLLPYAAGQVYALGAEIAGALVAAAPQLRRMGNEDVSLGAWLVGLRHSPADDPSFCCPDACALPARAGAPPRACVAVVQPACAGVCEPERTLPLLSAGCGVNGTGGGYARAQAALREGAAAAEAKRRGDGAGGDGGGAKDEGAGEGGSERNEEI